MSFEGVGAAGAPLSLEVQVNKLPRAGMPLRFEADETERARLASHLGIPAVEWLQADLLVAPWRGDGVRVSGRLDATVVQSCVVSLAPVTQDMSEEVSLLFVPSHSKLARIARPEDKELLIDPDGEDIPDEFSGDRIDLGASLTELVALGLDPYPRAPGVGFDAVDTDPRPDEKPASPFAKLAGFKPRSPSGGS